MSSTGITPEAAAALKKKILDRDGGYTNANAAELLSIDKMVGKDEAVPDESNVPVHVVNVPVTEVPRAIIPQTPTPVLPKKWSDEELNLIKAKVAPDCTDSELKLLLYMSHEYGLDPLLKQIWAVKRSETQPALIFVGRDGMLAVAHRSGHFDGMKSWVDYDEKGIPTKGHCVIWRNDMAHPFESEVLFKEYEVPVPKSGYKGLWQTKPSVMLIKVAESVCLRKAFSISGVYDPDEVS
jgi:phage recombination protein Bet